MIEKNCPQGRKRYSRVAESTNQGIVDLVAPIDFDLAMRWNMHSRASSLRRSSKALHNISSTHRRVHVPQARTIRVHARAGSHASARPVLTIWMIRQTVGQKPFRDPRQIDA